ncbi:hypothetical protein L345_08875, partial [Ophiophagus hannah]
MGEAGAKTAEGGERERERKRERKREREETERQREREREKRERKRKKRKRQRQRKKERKKERKRREREKRGGGERERERERERWTDRERSGQRRLTQNMLQLSEKQAKDPKPIQNQLENFMGHLGWRKKIGSHRHPTTPTPNPPILGCTSIVSAEKIFCKHGIPTGSKRTAHPLRFGPPRTTEMPLPSNPFLPPGG